MSQPSLQIDPLNSPHPIPWSWVMATLSNPGHSSTQHSYRSQSLISPTGEYSAYSRIQLQAADLYTSSVSSILFIENLRTGDFQVVTPTSPLANNPFLHPEGDTTGKISIAVPVSWSESGDRLLSRVFEAIFCSDIASDYALIVDAALKQTSTIAPTAIHYTTAVLLGWSAAHPEQALFRAGNLGEENWPLWAVDQHSKTVPVECDRPAIFGQTNHNIWMGPQVQV